MNPIVSRSHLRFDWYRICLVLLLCEMFTSAAYAVVNMKNGNFANTFTVIELEHAKTRLPIGITYNSRSTFDGLFGYGWCSDLESSLKQRVDGSVVVKHCGGGAEYLFHPTTHRGRSSADLVNDILEVKERHLQSNTALLRFTDRRYYDGEIKEFRQDLLQDPELLDRFARAFGFPSYEPISGERFNSKDASMGEIIYNGAEYVWTPAAGNREYRFDASGALTKAPIVQGREVSRIHFELRRSKNRLVFVVNDHEVMDVYISQSGKIESLESRSGQQTKLGFDSNGNLISISKQGDELYAFEYNRHRHMVRAKYPDSTYVSLGYDVNNKWVTSYQDRKRCIEDYEYVLDPADPKLRHSARVVKHCGDELVNTSRYDFQYSIGAGLSRVTSNVNGDRLGIKYDSTTGRPTHIDRNGNTHEFRYDSRGRVREKLTPGELQHIGYEGDSGRIASITYIFPLNIERNRNVRILYSADMRQDTVDELEWDSQIRAKCLMATQPRGVKLSSGATLFESGAGSAVITSHDGTNFVFSRRENHFDGFASPLSDSFNQDQVQLLLESAHLCESLDVFQTFPVVGKVPHPTLNISSPYPAGFSKARVSEDWDVASRILATWWRELATGGQVESVLSIANLAKRIGDDLVGKDRGFAGELFLKEALDAKRFVGDGAGSLDVMLAIAKSLIARNQIDQARKSIDEYVQVAKQTLGNDPSLPRVLEQASYLYLEIDQNKDAATMAGLAARHRTDLGVLHLGEGLRLNGGWYKMATLLEGAGLLAHSVQVYVEELTQSASSGWNTDRSLETISGLAYVLATAGRNSDAIELREYAAAAWERKGRERIGQYISALIQLANAYTAVDRYSDAFAALKRAEQPGFESYISQGTIGRDINAVKGRLFRLIGQLDLAVSHYNRALEIEKTLPNSSGSSVANLQLALGASHRLRGDYSLAEHFTKEAVNLKRNVLPDTDWSIGWAHIELARLYLDERRWSDSLSESSIGARLLVNSLGDSHHLTALARVVRAKGLAETGQAALADQEFRLAVFAATTSESPSAKWQVAYEYSSFLAQRGQVSAAIFFGEVAVDIIQRLRSVLGDDATSLANSFAKDKSYVYSHLAELLLGERRFFEAREVVRQLKLGELESFTRAASTIGNSEFSNSETVWKARWKEIEKNVIRLSAELRHIEGKSLMGPLTPNERNRQDALRHDMSVATKAFDAAVVEILATVAAPGSGAASRANELRLAQIDTLQGALESLGSGTVALHYVVGESRISILITLPNIQVSRHVEIKEQDLRRLILAFNASILSKQDTRASGQALYDVLVKPIRDDLEAAKAKTLILSLDGELRYVSFPALFDGTSYLATKYATAWLTEAARENILASRASTWKIVGLGTTKSLPAVREELESVVTVGTERGPVYLDSEFTMERLRQVLRQRFPVVHIATHFNFVPGSFEQSYLQLGDGKLTVQELFDNRQTLKFRDVDMVTLSACDTASSSLNGTVAARRGADIESFAALVQRNEAKSVVATLWFVADKATAVFMRRYYDLLWRNPELSKAEALQVTQLSFIDQGDTYGQPFYWAPFTLMGNIR